MFKNKDYKYKVKFDIGEKIACYDKNGQRFYFGEISGINIGESKEITYSFKSVCVMYSNYSVKKNNFYYLTEKQVKTLNKEMGKVIKNFIKKNGVKNGRD